MDLQRIKIFVCCISYLLVALNLLFMVDYQDLSWEANKSSFIGICTGLLVGTNMLISLRNDTKNTQVKSEERI